MMNVCMHLYVIVEFWLMVSAVRSARISLYKTETKTHIHTSTHKKTHMDINSIGIRQNESYSHIFIGGPYKCIANNALYPSISSIELKFIHNLFS